MTMKKSQFTHSPNPESEHSGQLGLERLDFFSDAVFAIAITLLTLEIRLPASENQLSVTMPQLSDEMLRFQLAGLWQRYLGYFISFIVIGVFWMSHHRKFRYIKRYDSRLVMLNLLLLMVIAFIPFPSSLISEYSQRSATIFYALVIMTAGLIIAVMWWYLCRGDRLIDPGLSEKLRRKEMLRPLLLSLVFLLSVGVAYLDADLAKLSWILILPVNLLASKDK
jgi:uncharacterized membrane protein